MRASADGHLPSLMASVLIFLGLLIGSVSGWLGGELVDRLGVGVDEGANLNAPNSLHGPARGQELVTEERFTVHRSPVLPLLEPRFDEWERGE